MRILIDFSCYNSARSTWEYKYQIIDEHFNQIKPNDFMVEHMFDMGCSYQEVMEELNFDMIIAPDKIYRRVSAYKG